MKLIRQNFLRIPTALLLGVFIHTAVFAKTVHVMTFNVENLFDTQDDPIRNDHSYLPLEQKQSEAHKVLCEKEFSEHGVKSWFRQCAEMNWDNNTFQNKLRQLAKTILQVNNGRGPEILILQEIENRRVLDELRLNHLQAANYSRPIIADEKFEEDLKRDVRGVDVAILTRLPKGGHPTLHKTEFTTTNEKYLADTREIMEQKLYTPDGKELTIFAVHLPAQHTDKTMRHEQLQHIDQLTERLAKRMKNFIVAGDFNINSREERDDNIYANHLSSHLRVAHHQDGEEQVFANHGIKGTYHFSEWSFLDTFLYPSYLEKNIVRESLQLVNSLDEQKWPDGNPRRFNPKFGTGVSDHFPLMMMLKFEEKEFDEGPDSLLRRKTLDAFHAPVGAQKVPVAFFDADSTLRITNNGQPTPNKAGDVLDRPLPFVADKLREFAQRGYFIAVVSNQGGVGPGFVSFENADAALHRSIEVIRNHGGTAHYMDFAAHKNFDRKPNPGMALRVEKFLDQVHGLKIDWENSFMVGDAAYKKTQIRPDGRAGFNFSSSDRGMAEELGITFFEPGPFFGWKSFQNEDDGHHGFELIQNLEDLEIIESRINQ